MKEGKTRHGTGRTTRRGTKEWNDERIGSNGEGPIKLPNKTTRTKVGLCLRICGPQGRYFWRAYHWVRVNKMKYTGGPATIAHRTAE